MLQNLNITIKRHDCFIFANKLSFFLFEIIDLNIFTIQVISKLFNFFLILLFNSLNNFIFVLLRFFFYLREVSFNNISHSRHFLEQARDFLLQLMSKCPHNFWLHCLDDTLDILLFIHVLSDETALEFHDCFNDQLKLISFRVFFILQNVVVFQNASDGLMEFVEGAGKNGLDCWFSHHTMPLKINERCDSCLMKRDVLFQFLPRDCLIFESVLHL